MQPVSAAHGAHLPQSAGLIWRRKPILWAGLVILLAGLLCLLLAYGFDGRTHRATFRELSCSPEGVTKFMNTVCNNIRAERITLLDTTQERDAYAGNVVIKPDGRGSAKASLRFCRENSNSTVARIEAGWTSFSADTDNKFACQLELIAALEKTLCGETQIRDFLLDRSSFLARICAPGNHGELVYAAYRLTDDLLVTVTVKVFGGSGDLLYWQIQYTLEVCCHLPKAG